MTASDFPNGMDFLKQFWQQSAAPAAAPAAGFGNQTSPAFAQAMGQYMMPTFDLEELDKRMADMRTVLHFMELNTQLLRQNLSALEVQRNTLATLQSMAAPAPAPSSAGAADTPDAAGAAAPWLAAWQSMVQAASKAATPADTSANTPATQFAAKPAAKSKAAPKKAVATAKTATRVRAKK